MTIKKISAWNKNTGEVLDFETTIKSIKPYGENGLILRDDDLHAVTQAVNMLRYCVPCEFTINFSDESLLRIICFWSDFSICFGEFCECHIWTFDGTIDIKE